MPFAIPDELVTRFREGRVIPFVGAGMSANVGYPSWDVLLERLGENLGQGHLTHEQVVELTDGNRLRVAEYYYLTEGKQVGPLRKEIHGQFKDVSPLDFGGYVDLVNLGSQRIYTTNFDDLIERAYRELGLPFERITTPRDLALSAGNKAEIIKYHGDLTNDPSLVLTESQYYSRLNFDSPMDLKFRADLLGKSVMFIGYSFSDINIRIIWFRLLDMMRGVEQTDMPTSYMVIVKPNPVEELLYKDAGIETIVLDPASSYKKGEYRELVGDFLYDLACRVCDPYIPNTDDKPFVSQTLLRRAKASGSGGPKLPWERQVNLDMQRLISYRLPKQYNARALDLFSTETDVTQDSVDAALSMYVRFPEDERLKLFLLRSSGSAAGMQIQDDERVDWESLGEMAVEAQIREEMLRKARRELNYHARGFDAELFFATYLVMDIREGKFGAAAEDQEAAGELLRLVEQRYPGVVETLRERGRGHIEEVAESYEPAEEGDEGVGVGDGLPFE